MQTQLRSSSKISVCLLAFVLAFALSLVHTYETQMQGNENVSNPFLAFALYLFTHVFLCVFICICLPCVNQA